MTPGPRETLESIRDALYREDGFALLLAALRAPVEMEAVVLDQVKGWDRPILVSQAGLVRLWHTDPSPGVCEWSRPLVGVRQIRDGYARGHRRGSTLYLVTEVASGRKWKSYSALPRLMPWAHAHPRIHRSRVALIRQGMNAAFIPGVGWTFKDDPLTGGKPWR